MAIRNKLSAPWWDTRPLRAVLSVLSLPYPSECERISTFGLRDSRAWILDLLPPIFAFAVLMLATSLGLKQQYWALGPFKVYGFTLDAESGIFVIGLVNKAIDMAVQGVIERIATLYNTMWMIQPSVGATIRDTQLKDEMTKPWAAMTSFYGMIQRPSSVKSSILRLFVTLIISTCVLVLGSNLNVIGWPKQRWYPAEASDMDTSDYSMQAPLKTISSVNWAQDMILGLEFITLDKFETDEDGLPLLDNSATSEIAGAISTQGAFSALTNLPRSFNTTVQDWYAVWTPSYQTAVYTSTNGPGARTISLHPPAITELFYEQKNNSKTFSKYATGFKGEVRLTLPLLTTVCNPGAAKGVSDNEITIQRDARQSKNSFSVLIGTSGLTGPLGLRFHGASCQVTFSQIIVPIATLITNNSDPSFSLANTVGKQSEVPTSINTSTADALITSRLTKHFNDTLPMLNGVVPRNGVVPHLVMGARTLSRQHPQFRSDSEAIAPVISVLVQNHLSAANWTMQTHDDILVRSTRMQWQIYVSGPNHQWQWIVIAVPMVILALMTQQMIFLVFYRIQPGGWLEPGGLLHASYTPSKNSSSQLSSIHVVGDSEEQEELAELADKYVRLIVKSLFGQDQWPLLYELTAAENDRNLQIQKQGYSSESSIPLLDVAGVDVENQPSHEDALLPTPRSRRRAYSV